MSVNKNFWAGVSGTAERNLTEAEKAEQREAFGRLVEQTERQPRRGENLGDWAARTGFDVGLD